MFRQKLTTTKAGKGGKQNMNDLVYRVTTDKSYTEAVEAVETQTPAHGFRVVHNHDYQAILAEKGFTREPLKIIEVCNAEYAHQVLQNEVMVSLMMPCRICVYVEDGQTVINTLRPTALMQMFPKPELQDFAEKVEKILIAIIDNSK